MALRFGEILKRNEARIVSDWEEAVTEAATRSPTPISLSGSVLRNHIPELLAALSAWLDSGEDATTGMALGLAARHALQRVEQAYQLHQVPHGLLATRRPQSGAGLVDNSTASISLH